VELNDYLRALRQHWVGAALIVLLATAAACGYSALQAKVYAATASGFVGTGVADQPGLGSVNDQLARSRATSYVSIAEGRATAQGVIDDLGLDTTPAALVTEIAVDQPVDTVLLKITARAGSPRLAQRLADAWVRALAAQVKQIEAPGVAHVPDGTPRVVPVEQADLPQAPVEPQISRNTALGLVVGLLLGTAYAVLRHTLDRKLRTAADFESRFRVPVVGTIPASAALRTERNDAADDPRASEAFRKLRTNLIFMDVDHPPKVLVITSPKPNDGKSTVAQNIARTLARSGERVVLIDADLRRPSVADQLGIEGSVGVTTVLSGQLELAQALQPVAGEPNLRVLAAGTLPPNPSEVLGSQAMHALLQRAAESGYVILDSPPLLPVTDAAVLATIAEGALVVASAGDTLDAEFGTALDTLAAVNARMLGVVLNRASSRSFGYRGRGYYYYAPATQSKGRRAKRKAAQADPPPQITTSPVDLDVVRNRLRLGSADERVGPGIEADLARLADEAAAAAAQAAQLSAENAELAVQLARQRELLEAEADRRVEAEVESTRLGGAVAERMAQAAISELQRAAGRGLGPVDTDAIDRNDWPVAPGHRAGPPDGPDAEASATGPRSD
jgi:capsular exopolysaccharide synthesis family protein